MPVESYCGYKYFWSNRNCNFSEITQVRYWPTFSKHCILKRRKKRGNALYFHPLGINEENWVHDRNNNNNIIRLDHFKHFSIFWIMVVFVTKVFTKQTKCIYSFNDFIYILTQNLARYLFPTDDNGTSKHSWNCLLATALT